MINIPLNLLHIVNRGEHDIINPIVTNKVGEKIWLKALDEKNIVSYNLSTHQHIGNDDILKKLLGIPYTKGNFFKGVPQSFKNLQKSLSSQQKEYLGDFLYTSVPVSLTYYEALTQIIFGQQISVKIANKQRMEFVKLFGRKINTHLYLYPKPHQVLKEKIESMPISTVKKKCLIEISNLFNQSNLDVFFNYESIANITTFLLKIYGCGQWTVDWFLLRGLGKLHIVPKGDLVVRKAFSAFFKKDQILSEKELLKIQDQYYPYGGVLAMQVLLRYVNKSS